MSGDQVGGKARPAALGLGRAALRQDVDGARRTRRGLEHMHELGVADVFDGEVDGIGDAQRRRGRFGGDLLVDVGSGNALLLRRRGIVAAGGDQQQEQGGGDECESGKHGAAFRGPLRALDGGERKTALLGRWGRPDPDAKSACWRGRALVFGLTAASCGSPLRDSPGFAPGSPPRAPSCVVAAMLPAALAMVNLRRRRGFGEGFGGRG